jgi:hypothetical protein
MDSRSNSQITTIVVENTRQTIEITETEIENTHLPTQQLVTENPRPTNYSRNARRMVAFNAGKAALAVQVDVPSVSQTEPAPYVYVRRPLVETPPIDEPIVNFKEGMEWENTRLGAPECSAPLPVVPTLPHSIKDLYPPESLAQIERRAEEKGRREHSFLDPWTVSWRPCSTPRDRIITGLCRDDTVVDCGDHAHRFHTTQDGDEKVDPEPSLDSSGVPCWFRSLLEGEDRTIIESWTWSPTDAVCPTPYSRRMDLANMPEIIKKTWMVYLSHGVHAAYKAVSDKGPFIRAVQQIRSLDPRNPEIFREDLLAGAIERCDLCDRNPDVPVKTVPGLYYAPSGGGKTTAQRSQVFVGLDTDNLIRGSSFDVVVRPFLEMGLAVITSQHQLAISNPMPTLGIFSGEVVRKTLKGRPFTCEEHLIHTIERSNGKLLISWGAEYISHHIRHLQAVMEDLRVKTRVLDHG